MPQAVTINPSTDALALRSILQAAQFRSQGDEEFFSGSNGEPISPSGSSAHDIVIFHDYNEKYRADTQELVHSWDYPIDEQALARAVELKLADLTVHELAHVAGVSQYLLLPLRWSMGDIVSQVE